MFKWKNLIIQLSIGIVCLVAGFWVGGWRAEKMQRRAFIFCEWADVQNRIKVLDSLYKGDSESAIQRMESLLDTDAIVVGPNEYNPRQITTEEKTILQMIATHRTHHPFSQPKHPGINDMVQKALQCAK
jgi:hypothetical protein